MDVLALTIALSFYAKNFFTFFLVLPPIVLFMLLKRQFARVAVFGLLIAILTVVVVGPWAYAIYLEGGWEYVRIVFVDNTVGRLFHLTDLGGFDLGPLNDAYHVEKNGNVLYYLPRLFVISAPWSVIFGVSLVSIFRKRREGDYVFFLKLALVTMVAVLSVSSSRAGIYLHPVLFCIYLIIADTAHDFFTRPGSMPRVARSLIQFNLGAVAVLLVLAPLWLWWLRGGILPIALALASAGVLILLVRRFRGRWHDWRSWYAYGCFVALACVGGVACGMPVMEDNDSAVVFFDGIRDEVDGVEIHTTYRDDRRLPLINYYLDRRACVVQDMDGVFDVLRRGERVGVILRRDMYASARSRFDEIPHTCYESCHPRFRFALVVNERDEESAPAPGIRVHRSHEPPPGG